MATFLVTAVQSSAFAEWKTLQVVNHTGYSIKKVQLSSIGRTVWGDNLLSGTLQNGDSAKINYSDEYRYWDLKITFMNDSYREWAGDHRLDLKDVWRITIYNSGRKEANGNMIFTVSYN